ncbi:mate-domain-containing protein [Mycena floridula]|nr:mate-domain-containing protein [Mycena floridula]
MPDASFAVVSTSLPSDHAIVSQYAAAHPEASVDSDQEELDDGDSLDESSTLRGSISRIPEIQSSSISTKSHGHPGPATEHTPLLAAAESGSQEIEDDDENPENKTTMFWQELRTLTKYSLPVFGTHLLEYSLVTSSVLSIGHISTTALAAITLGSMTASVSGFSIIQGFTSALDTLLPSAWTSSQPELVSLWCHRMAVVLAACLIPILTIWGNSETILLALKQDPEVAKLAATYLRWISLGLPAYAFNCISRRYFQSQGLFTVPTQIIFIIAPLNAVLNFLLVWGPEPIRLGYIGAPIATAISFNLVSILSIAYGYRYLPEWNRVNGKSAWHPICRRSFTSLGVLVHFGLAGVAQTASEWWAWELVALGASLISPVALATQSVLLVSASTTFQAPFALSVATSVRIGNLLGEKQAKRAGVAANTAIVMAMALACLFSAMFLIFRNSWAYMFNDDPEVVELVASILPLVALFQIFDGNSAVTGGILRARGKQVTGALLNLSAYYIIGIPFGMVLAFSETLHLGLYGLWIGLTVSLVYCGFLGTWISLKTDWDKEVWKVGERLERERRLSGSWKTRTARLEAGENEQ